VHDAVGTAGDRRRVFVTVTASGAAAPEMAADSEVVGGVRREVTRAARANGPMRIG
jgi:hypothetical protein